MFGTTLRLCVLFAVVLFASTACGGGGQSGSAPTAVEPPVNSAASSTDFAHGPFLFVTNDLEISIFPLSANGDVAPVKTIPNLNSPIAFAPNGNLLAGGQASIGEFRVNTGGTLSTVRTISFDCTLGATGIAADAQDTVYISSSPDAPNYGIDIVPEGVTDCGGNPKAIAGDRTELGSPGAVDVGRDGTVYVLNDAVDYGVPSVTTYAPGASGNVAPLHRLLLPPRGAFYAQAMALDGAGDVFVAGIVQKSDYTDEAAIFEFAPLTSDTPATLRAIEGPHTGLTGPSSIAVGSDGTLYVSDASLDANIADVEAFAPGANGDVAPVRRISGSKTGLSANGGPYGIALTANYASCTASP